MIASKTEQVTGATQLVLALVSGAMLGVRRRQQGERADEMPKSRPSLVASYDRWELTLKHIDDSPLVNLGDSTEKLLADHNTRQDLERQEATCPDTEGGDSDLSQARRPSRGPGLGHAPNPSQVDLRGAAGVRVLDEEGGTAVGSGKPRDLSTTSSLLNPRSSLFAEQVTAAAIGAHHRDCHSSRGGCRAKLAIRPVDGLALAGQLVLVLGFDITEAHVVHGMTGAGTCRQIDWPTGQGIMARLYLQGPGWSQGSELTGNSNRSLPNAFVSQRLCVLSLALFCDCGLNCFHGP